MYAVLQVVTVMLVALAAALSGAHALELPGKMRLDRDTYFAVQRIYYPGFTIGGAAEFPAVLLTAVLLVRTPPGTTSFWLVLVALAGMVATVAIYWVLIHPVNRYWTEGQAMGALGSSFFGSGRKTAGEQPDWTELRNRWEHSHVARAVVSSISLLALVVLLVARAGAGPVVAADEDRHSSTAFGTPSREEMRYAE